VTQIFETSSPAQSLVWFDGRLSDPVSGRWWDADGSEDNGSFMLGSPFDQAFTFGQYLAVYVERGTKALLFKGDQMLGEMNRSYYQADVYDYPITLGTLPDGRTVLIHCPYEYNVLEIEDAETRESLTERDNEADDVFHSRLEVSPDGRRLLSVGWIWHPYATLKVFDLAAVLRDPALLDGKGETPPADDLDGEVAGACWLDADRIAVSTSTEMLITKESRSELGVWSLAESAWTQRHRMSFPLGQLIACGETVISLYGHPRQISIATGEIVAEWPEISLPEREFCYGVTHIPSPVAALHPDGTRLAVAQESGIAILELNSVS
jgi:hypothetical protein